MILLNKLFFSNSFFFNSLELLFLIRDFKKNVHADTHFIFPNLLSEPLK